ncbi:MAG: M20/M25/M40 family metallo-hydrolase [Gemmatimonadaceae bacterium]|nr:M20/M25/M40 family metallo-hydrolase [Gemmatimonadaceae bacterium]
MPPRPFAELWSASAGAREAVTRADDQTLARQLAVAAIPAPTGSEGPRAAFVARQFRAAGLYRVATDAAGNVLGWLGPREGAAVVVCAHLDTVFAADVPHVVVSKGPRYVGPGIGDNARGLAAVVAIATALRQHATLLARPVLFAATTGEEGDGDLRGARHLFGVLGAQAHSAVIVDGPGDDRVVHDAVGARRYRLHFAGPGGHSWADSGAPSAVHAAARCAVRLADWPVPTTPRSSLTVARAAGGSAINAIASDAWLEVDVRSTSETVLDRLDRELRRIAAASAETETSRGVAGSGRIAVTVDVIGARPAGSLDARHELVQAAYAATRAIGKEPVPATASTDANVPLSLGIPAVAIGAGGDGGGAHTVDEWYDNRGGARGVARALGVIVAAAG